MMMMMIEGQQPFRLMRITLEFEFSYNKYKDSKKQSYPTIKDAIKDDSDLS